MTVLQETLKAITPISDTAAQRARSRLDSLTKPQGSLGRLEDLAIQIAAITATNAPRSDKKVIFTLAADHGVTEEKVSAFPKEVTAQMVYNFLQAGAAINVLGRHTGARVIVADVGVAVDLNAHPDLRVKKINYGTRNMAQGPAMSRQEAIRSLENGIALFEDEYKSGIDIAAIGEMGIGNTTISSAITAAATGTPVEEVTGRGTGIDEAGLAHKISVIKRALSLNAPCPSDPLDLLAKVGGFEFGGMAGIALACARHRVPVIIDGFNSGAAALIACLLCPEVKGYMIASHKSVERGHQVLLNYLGMRPLLELDLRLGEGTGAALVFPLIDAALKIMNEMATFESAKVSQRTH